MNVLEPITNENNQAMIDFINKEWGSPIMVSKGKIHHVDRLPGFMVRTNKNEIIGLITYNIKDKECEIVTLDSKIEKIGIGTELVHLVLEEARKNNCQRVWLITTNDNTNAIKFYQKRGFNIKAIHINAINEARGIKPEIPKYGFDNIPILHEIEFEKIL